MRISSAASGLDPDAACGSMSRVEMPPLTVMVLDGLADDLESVGTLRDHGEVAPYGLALVDEEVVVEALRELLVDGLVEAWELAMPKMELVPAAQPATDDASLGRYWFKWTSDGERMWREGHDVLDTYWDAHPRAG
jgi:hypothetical protein